jgi:hypothetical protein
MSACNLQDRLLGNGGVERRDRPLFDLHTTSGELPVVSLLIFILTPSQLLWKAQLSKKRKSLFLVVFSGGFFVMACGILRCTLILLVCSHAVGNTDS